MKVSDSAGRMKAPGCSAPDSEGASEGEDERQRYSPDSLALVISDSDASWQQASVTMHMYGAAPSQWPRLCLQSTEPVLEDRTPLMNIFSQVSRDVDTSDTWATPGPQSHGPTTHQLVTRVHFV